MTRAIEVRVTVTLPDEAHATPADVVAEVGAALEVGTDADNTPALAVGVVMVDWLTVGTR